MSYAVVVLTKGNVDVQHFETLEQAFRRYVGTCIEWRGQVLNFKQKELLMGKIHNGLAFVTQHLFSVTVVNEETGQIFVRSEEVVG